MLVPGGANSILLALSPFISASGGTITFDGNFKIHSFTAGSSLVVTNAPPGATYDYLLAGGGGGGGGGAGGGGGGGGGVLTGTAAFTLSGTYPVVVGAGGVAVNGNGAQSSFNGLIAYGGGYGGYFFGGPPSSGGCGGGGEAGYRSPPGDAGYNGHVGASGVGGQGYSGGNGYGMPGEWTASGSGAGGGGAGGAGVGYGYSNTYGSNVSPGVGGIGKSSTIRGTLEYFGGGGAGSLFVMNAEGSNYENWAQGPQVAGGGGYQGSINGQANTGGGGCASCAAVGPGNGGSGIVIIRYRYK